MYEIKRIDSANWGAFDGRGEMAFTIEKKAPLCEVRYCLPYWRSSPVSSILSPVQPAPDIWAPVPGPFGAPPSAPSWEFSSD